MKVVYSLILSCLLCPLFGQNINTGSPFSGMANSCIMLSSPWSVFHNQAGISEIKNYIFGISYIEKFHNDAFSTRSVFVVCPSKWLVSSLDYQNFGYSKFYHEQMGLSFSRLLARNFSMGVKLKYIHSFIEMFNHHKTDYNFDLGFQYRIEEMFYFGVHISNPVNNNSGISEQLLRFGAAFKYSDLLFSVEYDKILNSYHFFALGINWIFDDSLVLKSGFNSIGNTKYMGVDYRYRKFYSSIAFSLHEVLGLSSQIAISYEI